MDECHTLLACHIPLKGCRVYNLNKLKNVRVRRRLHMSRATTKTSLLIGCQSTLKSQLSLSLHLRSSVVRLKRQQYSTPNSVDNLVETVYLPALNLFSTSKNDFNKKNRETLTRQQQDDWPELVGGGERESEGE